MRGRETTEAILLKELSFWGKAEEYKLFPSLRSGRQVCFFTGLLHFVRNDRFAYYILNYTLILFHFFLIMQSLTSQEIRQRRSDFWTSKAHTHLPEASLIADKESTALFNVAGMQPLIPYLAGKEHPLGHRLFNIQKCVRTVDIDEVGDSSHLTFFEMMGNWSLGDYFKKEAIQWSYEFLVEKLNFDPRKLAVTVFEGNEDAPRDEIAFEAWKQAGLPEERISFLDAKNNRWSPGPVGPCGPDTEIYYRVGKSEFPPAGSNVKTDEDNWLEIWNNVFMEFYRDEKGILTKLSQQNVDTGMGLERMCKVLQHKESVYETDLFAPFLHMLEQATELKYADHQRKFRIIADHLRTAFMLINDGLTPSNVGAGYVLRMIIRRGYYNLFLLRKMMKPELEHFIDQAFVAFKGLRDFNEPMIKKVLLQEIAQFEKTIHNGEKILTELLDKLTAEGKKTLGGDQIFMLYDTYGFPLEITKELAADRGVALDLAGYEKALEAAKEKSRQGSKAMFQKSADWSKYLEGIPATEFVGYENLNFSDAKLLKEIDTEEGQKVLIFDKTPFYPEMGGQNGDAGVIELDDGRRLEIMNVQKVAGVILHFVG